MRGRKNTSKYNPTTLFQLVQHTRQTRSRNGRLNSRLLLRSQETCNERRNLCAELGYYRIRFLEALFPENTVKGGLRTVQYELLLKVGIVLKYCHPRLALLLILVPGV
jgi:hypothetical protein